MNVLNTLPVDIQADWMAALQRYVAPNAKGHFYLVDIQRTAGVGYQGQRIIVSVVDENGFPMAGVKVAFAYSTADQYIITPDFLWMPPAPPKAFVVPTGGGGQIDQIQGDVVKQGQPGGVTAYLLEPQYSSDAVSGCGMLADHTGLHLTFQLQRYGVKPLGERIDDLEARVKALEAKDVQLIGQ